MPIGNASAVKCSTKARTKARKKITHAATGACTGARNKITEAATARSRSKASAHLYVARGNVCAQEPCSRDPAPGSLAPSALPASGSLAPPTPPASGGPPPDTHGQRFPRWTRTQKGLAPPRPPAPGLPRPGTHGQRFPAGSGRALPPLDHGRVTHGAVPLPRQHPQAKRRS